MACIEFSRIMHIFREAWACNAWHLCCSWTRRPGTWVAVQSPGNHVLCSRVGDPARKEYSCSPLTRITLSSSPAHKSHRPSCARPGRRENGGHVLWIQKLPRREFGKLQSYSCRLSAPGPYGRRIRSHATSEGPKEPWLHGLCWA
jgi:hypothetical protein